MISIKKDVNSMLNKICVEYTNHEYAICQIVRIV